ncbi:hypothetical protein P9139_06995 [Curtobacterium flaccumfaciens]|nr:hypothetical protein P9139_06995 [Curtobacterium flaccumfaciens]
MTIHIVLFRMVDPTYPRSKRITDFLHALPGSRRTSCRPRPVPGSSVTSGTPGRCSPEPVGERRAPR